MEKVHLNVEERRVQFNIEPHAPPADLNWYSHTIDAAPLKHRIY